MIKYVMLLCFFVVVNLNIQAQDTSQSQGGKSDQNNTNQGTGTDRNTQQGARTDENNVQGNTQTQGNNNADSRQFQSFNSVCPVDGQQVDPSIKPIRYKGKEYGFDSPSCAVVFSDNPDLYAGNLTDNGEKYTHHELEPEDRTGIENQNMQDNENQENEREDNNNKDNQQ